MPSGAQGVTVLERLQCPGETSDNIPKERAHADDPVRRWSRVSCAGPGEIPAFAFMDTPLLARALDERPHVVSSKARSAADPHDLELAAFGQAVHGPHCTPSNSATSRSAKERLDPGVGIRCRHGTIEPQRDPWAENGSRKWPPVWRSTGGLLDAAASSTSTATGRGPTYHDDGRGIPRSGRPGSRRDELTLPEGTRRQRVDEQADVERMAATLRERAMLIVAAAADSGVRPRAACGTWTDDGPGTALGT